MIEIVDNHSDRRLLITSHDGYAAYRLVIAGQQQLATAPVIERMMAGLFAATPLLAKERIVLMRSGGLESVFAHWKRLDGDDTLTTYARVISRLQNLSDIHFIALFEGLFRAPLATIY